MAKTLEKARKAISKKRAGVPNALHEKSRDSMRLRRANVRDHKLQQLAQTRNKKEQPIVDRVSYFQIAVRERLGEPLELKEVQELITKFIHQYDEEFEDVKKTRRAGRPASAREDLLKMKIANFQTEYEQGFWLPDVMSAENAKLIDQWEGSWTYVSSIPWIKLTSAGQFRPADFPSKGLN